MAGFGFETGLALRQRRVGVAVPPAVSAISSLAVQGAATLPDGADAAVPNGWVAKAVMPWDAAATFDPTKIVLTVSDPGFDASGAATLRTRTVRGGAVIRRQYANQAQRLAAHVSTNLEVYFSLADWIYAGSTIVAASAEAGHYGVAAAGPIASAANESTLAYPKPLFAWLNLQHERATGSAFAVEAVAYHRHAMLGRQVACVQFAARDAQSTPNVSATQTAAAPVLSSFQTGGQRVETYKASVPLSALSQGDLCQATARVFPWIGDASAVLDLDADAIGWPTPNPQTRLRFVNDKSGAYGGGYAYVKAGASGGAVSATAASARAAPFATIAAALTGLAAWNGANRGHADHSGSTIRLMDDGAGGAVDHAIADTSATVAGACWTQIEVDPLAVGAVRAATASEIGIADKLRWCCPLSLGANGRFNGYDVKMMAFDGATIASTSGIALNFWLRLHYHRNVTVLSGPSPWHSYSSYPSAAALVLGCTMKTGGSADIAAPYAFIGNDTEGVTLIEFPTSHAEAVSHDRAVIANNRMLKQQGSNILGNQRAYSGLAIVQNVFERAISPNSENALAIGGDGATATIANLVMQHNSVPGVDQGARVNLLYADDAGSVGVAKTGSLKFNLFHQYNVKTDTYTTVTATSGRTRNWALRYGVGNAGNVVSAGDTAGASAVDASGGNWLGEYREPGSAINAGAIGFVDDRSGTARGGGGIYALTGTSNPAFARVPAGGAVLAFDLAGAARRSDGTGAAGAYERA